MQRRNGGREDNAPTTSLVLHPRDERIEICSKRREKGENDSDDHKNEPNAPPQSPEKLGSLR
jgi:hypothetical protein